MVSGNISYEIIVGLGILVVSAIVFFLIFGLNKISDLIGILFRKIFTHADKKTEEKAKPLRSKKRRAKESDEETLSPLSGYFLESDDSSPNS
jgi:hypothetical protein